MYINISGLTDIGQSRNENQDSIDWHVAPQYQYGYLLVADGMGGYTGGAIASQLASETIGTALKSLPYDPAFGEQPDEILLRRTLQTALEQANRRILDTKLSQPQLAQMGTTVVAAVIWQHIAVIAHIGDSRAYLWQDHQLTQLTRDHSLVQELIDSGTLSIEEAERSQQRNVLTRALGVNETVEPSFTTIPLTRDCLLLACSDGLTGYLNHAGLTRELGRDLPILESCYRLVQTANSAGGRDNISVVIAEIAA